jgi:hypothetical protein
LFALPREDTLYSHSVAEPGTRNALSFPGELQKLTCRQSSILIDAMRYSLPLTGPSLL